MKKILYTFLILIAGLILFIIIKYNSYYTPHVITDHGAAFLEEIELDGQKQTILVRSDDLEKPMVIFLHGGPGMPMMFLAHAFQRELERHFVIVHWDQLGAGKSYHEEIDPELLNVEQFIEFTRDLTLKIKNRFGKDKVLLVGHSWGSYLGILTVKKYPELFYGFISVGQVVDTEQARIIQESFIREQANLHNRPEAIEEIEEQGYSIYEKWLFEFGAELADSDNYWPLVLQGILAPEYSISDIRKIAEGSDFSSANMKYNAIQGSVIDEIDSLEVPVFFFTGKHDYTTPFELVEQFHDKIIAPEKGLIWFENSAHFPFIEETDRFNYHLVRISDQLRNR